MNASCFTRECSSSGVARKLRSQAGIAWIVVILAVACAVMFLIVVGEPVILSAKERMAVYSCNIAVDKAQDMIDVEILQHNNSLSLKEAYAVMERSKWAMDTLCPAGGECYLVSDGSSDGKARYTVVCGLHDTDQKRRCRLNAQNVLDKISEEVKRKRLVGAGDAESIKLTLNGETLTAYQKADELTRGTYTTPGYSGTVAFYTLDDEGVTRLSFADENYCANWRRGWGWDGDSIEAPVTG